MLLKKRELLQISRSQEITSNTKAKKTYLSLRLALYRKLHVTEP